MAYDFLIVGAGFSGAVCAEQLARAGKRVLVVDRRPHLGGNAHDELDDHGVLVHRHGPHIFHTDSERIFRYLGDFTRWRFYEHRVLAELDGDLYPIPINRTTINRLYGLDLDEAGLRAFLDRVRVPSSSPRTSEEWVLSRVGEDLCEKFFRGYTRKQWGVDLSQLDAGVAARIPVRSDDDDRYFGDAHQFMPEAGYGPLFENLLDSPNIDVEVGVDFADLPPGVRWRQLVFTGPIDRYFGCCFGELPYRSIRFEHHFVPDRERFQPVGTINYPGGQGYTRVTEFKHLTGQQVAGTSIVREHPQAEGEPYYPVPSGASRGLSRRYRQLAAAEKEVHFVGRLAQYRYYNMDQAVAAALALADRLLAGGA